MNNRDVVIVLGDFNAQVGNERKGWEGWYQLNQRDELEHVIFSGD